MNTRLRMEELQRYVMPLPWSGCWIWLGFLNADGYGKPKIGGRETYAHRAFYEHFVGPLAADDCVLHRCDVRCCVNPAHLSKGTRTDNMNDMWAKGRGKPKRHLGTEHGMAKLTDDLVRFIRSDPRPGTQVALELGVSNSTVYGIRKREKWAHVC